MSLLDTRHKRKSFTLTSILISGLILLLFYVGLSYLDPPLESGISVNFGTTNFGSGTVQPKEKIKSEPVNKPIKEQPQEVKEVTPPTPAEPEPQETAEKAEKVITQDNEEAIAIKKAEEEKKKIEDARRKAEAEAERLERERKAEEARKEAERKAEEERVRQEQEAKKRKLDAMMGGLNKSDGTATGSEGDDGKPGDKGQLNGDPYASSYFGSPGTGSGGVGYGLNGRNLVSGDKFVQDCNESGRVVVKIEVDRNGNVVNATPGVKGSTNTAQCLKEAAEKTARSYRWNSDANAPARQIGFVVVNFKLGE
ncbi:energy transducer TonB [Robertkochia solimangrovi]|uniref:energy transducer TonB n=1 Tax=Robertkochia solimangrovi TaxID=2213046 RepID=UPI00117FDC21|nr:energy transducer TonB [Robertkochia solimangrovi]TRZ44297.1 energy transducer TonB [Robertkochia solimangrovi]